MSGEALLVFHIRPARRKARATAVLEAMSLLAPLEPCSLPGGPLPEEGPSFWLSVPVEALESAAAVLPRLGYTESVTALVPSSTASRDVLTWKGGRLERRIIYQADASEARDQAPDRRPFLVRTPEGAREIVGYRGDGGALSRRGLPFYDACLLVNLVTPRAPGARILDPFAGIGGIVRETANAAARAIALDNDAWLSTGLAAISSGRHILADCRWLPFVAASIEAVATEPPYDQAADPVLEAGIGEIARVLRPGARASMLCSARQSLLASSAASQSGLRELHSALIDRKGTDCALFLWEKR
jgi:hypothetical protein